MKDRLINWELVDLFGSNSDDDDDDIKELDDEDESYLDKEKKELNPSITIRGPKGGGKIVSGPLGMLVMDNAYHPLRGLEAYVAHVNFPITKKILNDLNNIDGIEVLKQLGRYRLLFIFGHMFDTEDVIDTIEKLLNITTQDDENDDSTNSIMEDIFTNEIQDKINSKFWAAYIYPNGRYQLENVSSEEELKTVVEHMVELKKLSNGVIYMSDANEVQTSDEI